MKYILKFIPEHKAEVMFAESLDESHDDIVICGLEYRPSEALKAVDPTAYRSMFMDWLDAEHMTVDE